MNVIAIAAADAVAANIGSALLSAVRVQRFFSCCRFFSRSMPDEKRGRFDSSASRRAIDLYAAAEFARIDERLKALEGQNRSNAERIEEVYGEVFGGPHGQVGLSETLRGVIKDTIRRWGLIALCGSSVLGALPWVIDHFTSLANKPILPPLSKEQDWKIHGGKRLRAIDQDGNTEYFYPEIKEPKK